MIVFVEPAGFMLIPRSFLRITAPRTRSCLLIDRNYSGQCQKAIKKEVCGRILKWVRKNSSVTLWTGARRTLQEDKKREGNYMESNCLPARKAISQIELPSSGVGIFVKTWFNLANNGSWFDFMATMATTWRLLSQACTLCCESGTLFCRGIDQGL